LSAASSVAPISVLHLLNRDHRRGAETFAVDLAAHQRRLVSSVRVAALQPGAGARLEGVTVLDPDGRVDRRLRALRSAVADVDVVVAHGSSTLPACAIGLAGTGIPFVYRLIGEPQYWSASTARRWRVRAFLARARGIAVYYPAAADVLAERYGVPRARLHVVPKGIDPTPFAPVDAEERTARRRALGIDPADRVVVSVGALSAEKHLEQAVDAVGRRSLAGDRIQLVVVGDGPARAGLEARARRGGAPVRFVGATDAPAEWYGVADAAVLTSRSEGVPSAVIEAGLMGIPVVATDVGGVGSVVRDGATGLLVAVDDVTATAAALGRVLDDGAAMGAAARAHCLDAFDIDVTARRWTDLLTAVVQDASRPRTRMRRKGSKSPAATRR